MTLAVVHNTVGDLVRAARAKFIANDVAEGKFQSGRVALGKMLVELRRRIEAGEEGDIEWWVFYKEKFPERSQSDANKLMKIGGADDPDAAYAEVRQKDNAARRASRAENRADGGGEQEEQTARQTSTAGQTADDRKTHYASQEAGGKVAYIIKLIAELTDGEREELLAEIEENWR